MLKKFLTLGLLGATLAFTGCQNMPDSSSNQTTTNLNLLQNKTWIATQIGNTPIKNPASMPNIPSIQFDEAEKRVTGSDGCNRYMGAYNAGRDTLSFGQMAGTRMACMDNNNIDLQFNQALAQVVHYQVYGKTLKLLDKHGNLLIQFESAIQPR